MYAISVFQNTINNIKIAKYPRSDYMNTELINALKILNYKDYCNYKPICWQICHAPDEGNVVTAVPIGLCKIR
jgi:hypothetical protein